MAEAFRPIPTDPTAAQVAAMFDARSEAWLLTTSGDCQCAAVETMREDGTDWQRMIAVEWPVRLNHDRTPSMLRLLVHPDDAVQFAATLLRTARWLNAAEELGK